MVKRSHTDRLSAATRAQRFTGTESRGITSVHKYFRWVVFLSAPSTRDRVVSRRRLALCSKKGVPSSSCRFSSRAPGGRTDPGSSRKPAGSPQVKDVSAKRYAIICNIILYAKERAAMLASKGSHGKTKVVEGCIRAATHTSKILRLTVQSSPVLF